MSQKVIEMLDQLEDRANKFTIFTGKIRGIVAATSSFIEKIYGRDHIFYVELQEPLVSGSPGREYQDHSEEQRRLLEILSSIRKEAESGLLFTNLRELVSAELFSNHLEMAEYLLDKDYKDLSALMIGTVLETHLRYLAEANSIDTRSGEGYKGAKRLNTELCREGVYNRLKLDQINLWWTIRNASAHGDYDEYNKEDVRQMLAGVRDFIAN